MAFIQQANSCLKFTINKFGNHKTDQSVEPGQSSAIINYVSQIELMICLYKSNYALFGLIGYPS